MRFRFIGKYTNGHTEVSIYGVRFVGHDPVTVDDDDTALNLMSHQEVEEVNEIAMSIVSDPKDFTPAFMKTDKPQLDHDDDGKAGGSKPRGRPRKAD